jgi:hypothetical protein
MISTQPVYQKMKTITVLRYAGQGILERCEVAIERCESSTGWGVAGMGPPEPINTTETTTLIGWGREDGEAIVHGSLIIPASTL